MLIVTNFPRPSSPTFSSIARTTRDTPLSAGAFVRMRSGPSMRAVERLPNGTPRNQTLRSSATSASLRSLPGSTTPPSCYSWLNQAEQERTRNPNLPHACPCPTPRFGAAPNLHWIKIGVFNEQPDKDHPDLTFKIQFSDTTTAKILQFGEKIPIFALPIRDSHPTSPAESHFCP